MYMGLQDQNPSHPQHGVAPEQDHLLYPQQSQAPLSTQELLDLEDNNYELFGPDRIDIDFRYASPATTAATLSTTASPRFDPALPFYDDYNNQHTNTASYLSSPASSSHYSPSPKLMPFEDRMIATQQQPYGYRGYPQQSLHQHHQLRPLDTQQSHLPRHNRDSSLSSLGSAGPASPLPYHRNGLGPHIAVADSGDGFGSYGSGFEDMTNHVYNIGGGKTAADSTLVWRPRVSMQQQQQPQQQQQQQQHQPQQQQPGLMQAPKLGGRMAERSRGLPQTWTTDSGSLGPMDATDSLGRRQKPSVYEPPKFFRTITDSNEDALYYPLPSPKSDMHPKTPHSSAANIYNPRLQQIRSAQPGVVGLGIPSPPTTASPFPRIMANGGSNTHGDNSRFRSLTAEPQGQFPTLQDRGHIKTEPDLSASAAHADAPQTMSPQDAMIQYHPGSEAEQHDFDHFFPGDFDLSTALNGFMPSIHSAPQPFSFVPHQSPHQSQAATAASEASDSENSPEYRATGPLRNPNMDASEKTYTCTYHGCVERFDTQKDLQKHKRDAHRPPNGHHSMARSTNQLSSQAGPHRCNRINPSTRRPCNTEFSRPYDLTRHEDTMHNVSKRKYRCPYCTTDNKTFSRRDALTRHHRVAHGIDTSRRRQRQAASSETQDGQGS